MNCGKYLTKTPEPVDPVIMPGTVVEFDYYGKTRRAKIKKVLRVNVEVLVVANKRRKTVRVPIAGLIIK